MFVPIVEEYPVRGEINSVHPTMAAAPGRCLGLRYPFWAAGELVGEGHVRVLAREVGRLFGLTS